MDISRIDGSGYLPRWEDEMRRAVAQKKASNTIKETDSRWEDNPDPAGWYGTSNYTKTRHEFAGNYYSELEPQDRTYITFGGYNEGIISTQIVEPDIRKVAGGGAPCEFDYDWTRKYTK
ncbi:hypothetical protein MNL76_04675 [Fervidobacterium riparium]|jgi:hypothetical protein|uniref:Uncharacterized protein n=1 Tax=Fervidobacterium pennivorans (strain DSM 9078 / Ven5) TaxID=771875 RepID=H9UDP6_FERPD|nr:hypothetical protein [Fervidobacterium pennivorans]AFG35639.1 hypothetical protein Ferpe_1575 [Fervidobacterium pennivorans DSM 9078]UXF00685.1 hypothetical protein IB67_03685 [Fervidobacterium riparium]